MCETGDWRPPEGVAAAAGAPGAAVGRPGSAAEALALVEAGLSFLASADAKALTSAELAGALQALARAESMHLAATSAVVTAFDRDGGYELDGRRSIGQWLVGRTRVTRAAAGWATSWARRLTAHPRVAAALAAGAISPSWARQICRWSDLLLADHRDEADAILLGAAASGADLDDLSRLAEELAARLARPGDEEDDRFARRGLWLDRHFRGAGKLDANLTPAAAEALQAVLDKLAVPAGPEDNRTQAQCNHDALEELCQLFLGGGLADGSGQPAQIQLHMTLQQLLGMAGSEQATVPWAGNGVTAPPGADCDASIAPVVNGHVDQDVLAELVAALLAGNPLPDTAPPDTAQPDTAPPDTAQPDTAPPDTAQPDTAQPDIAAGNQPAAGGPATHSAASPVTGPAPGDSAGMAERAAAQLAIKNAVRLLSGPGGLAAFLRTGLLTGAAAAISLPLDAGRATETIPAHLRRAVTVRDKHCVFPGCDRRAARCHVHHLIPRADGGPTSLENCCLLCTFHHLIAIHRWGWQLVLNPDGTTTATSPDRRRVFHSHAPPEAA